MPQYDLLYNHPHFVEMGDDNLLQNVKRTLSIPADTDEEAVTKAKEFLAKPTGEKYYPDAGSRQSEDLFNSPIKLTKVLDVKWD